MPFQENGYQLLFLSARAISQAGLTRQFLFNLKQVPLYCLTFLLHENKVVVLKVRIGMYSRVHCVLCIFVISPQTQVLCRMERDYQMGLLLFPLMGFFLLCLEKVGVCSEIVSHYMYSVCCCIIYLHINL